MTATKDIAEEAAVVGRFEMRIVAAEPAPDSEERWSRRSEALAAWLLDEWERERWQHEARLTREAVR